MGSETPPPPHAFMVDCARFYRGLGFFREYTALSDEQLADRLEEIRVENGSWNLDPNRIMGQMVLASWDKNRVWWEDMEWMGEDPARMYTDILTGWSRISRGAFLPTDIVERWEDPAEEGTPVIVEFTLNGARQHITLENMNDWVDGEILVTVNRLLAPTKLRLETADTNDQTGYLIALTLDERYALERRGWRFSPAKPPAPPAAPAPKEGPRRSRGLLGRLRGR